MELTINKKEYKLHFGIDFIRELDKRYTVESGGMQFGAGLQSAVVHLINRNVVVLEDIILSATHTLKSIPSKEDIEVFLIEYKDLTVLFDDFLEQLKTAPLTALTVKPIIDEIMKKQ